MPYLELLMIKHDGGDHFFAHDAPEAGIAKHLGNIYREFVQEFIYELRILSESFEQGFDIEFLQFHYAKHASLKGRHSVVPKVIMILLKDKLRNPFKVGDVDIQHGGLLKAIQN